MVARNPFRSSRHSRSQSSPFWRLSGLPTYNFRVIILHFLQTGTPRRSRGEEGSASLWIRLAPRKRIRGVPTHLACVTRHSLGQQRFPQGRGRLTRIIVPWPQRVCPVAPKTYADSTVLPDALWHAHILWPRGYSIPLLPKEAKSLLNCW